MVWLCLKEIYIQPRPSPGFDLREMKTYVYTKTLKIISTASGIGHLVISVGHPYSGTPLSSKTERIVNAHNHVGEPQNNYFCFKKPD